MRFWKGQALGNDYLVVDQADLPWPLTAARVRALCDRWHGIGSDGVLLVDTAEAPYRLRIFNPDGSEAEKSGNGLRILAAYLYERRLVDMEPFSIRLPGETVEMRVEEVGHGGVLQVTVAMGPARFTGRDVGFQPEPGNALGYRLSLDGGDAVEINPVSVGNPHCVVFRDTLDHGEFLRVAPRLTSHQAFAGGTNVQFARVAGADQLEILIWERGAGETLASGSSASAAAAAAVRLGHVPPGTVTVNMPGGTVRVDISPDFAVTLGGPAQMVYTGELLPAVVEAMRR